ncbi:HIRA1 [Auxenochlorella protothecoides x Auxenochlorella symbiontica]
MLVDKLPWCSHDGHPIFSVHPQPGSIRFATAGSDGKAKIWSLGCALDAKQEAQPGAHKLLATLTEHNGPVNVVRFSHNGRQLATGSDDHLACVFELRPGPGVGSLGSSTPNIENWRLKAALRGHGNNVVDVAWSPDDALLATASLDGTAAVWAIASGQRVARLDAHTNFVKGVAWDPVGSYLATQSDDKSVIVWRVEDWSQVARIVSPFSMMISSTFALRCSWSPDGQWLLAGNSFQGATHAAVLVPRERWTRPKDYLLISGHSGAVVCGAFNPRLFSTPSRASRASGKENGDANGEAANGSGEAAAGDDAAHGAKAGRGDDDPDADALAPVFAIGSQDRRATVWTAGADRPIFCASRFFNAQVLDLAWTSSGYGLLASSTDGTVAIFQFDCDELGAAAPPVAVDGALQTLYGRSGAGLGQRRRLVESVEQLELEEAAGKGPEGATGSQAPEPSTTAAPVPAPPVSTTTPAQPSAPADLAALDARLGGAAASFGFSPSRAPQAGTAPGEPPAATRIDVVPQRRPAAARERGAESGAVLAGAPRPAPLAAPALQRELLLRVDVPPGVFAGKAGDAATALELRIVNRPGSASVQLQRCAAPGAANATTQPRCVLWTDSLPCGVTCAAATPALSALGLQDGSLLVYSPAGRRLAGPLQLGAGVARLAARDARLLALTTSGVAQLWVLGPEGPRSLLRAGLACLLEGGARLAGLALSAAGAPVATLSDGAAYVYAPGLDAWTRAAEAGVGASAHRPGPLLAGAGELERMQAEALAAGAGAAPARALAVHRGDAAATRAHLEASLAAALALRSAEEYRSWLLKYASFLAEARDETRLRELCSDLLGPPGPASRGAPPTGAMDGVADPASSQGWEPRVLGLDKRDLLRSALLPAIARNRELQSLAARFRDALDDLQELS